MSSIKCYVEEKGGKTDRVVLLSRGANGLIRDGAALVEEAKDILNTLGVLTLEAPRPASLPAPTAAGLPEAQRRLLECLSLTPKHVDALAADLRMTATEVAAQMTLMEISGLVRRLPGSTYIRVL